MIKTRTFVTYVVITFLFSGITCGIVGYVLGLQNGLFKGYNQCLPDISEVFIDFMKSDTNHKTYSLDVPSIFGEKSLELNIQMDNGEPELTGPTNI